ncbi:MAG: SIR2 family protein [Thiolinea sp.]
MSIDLYPAHLKAIEERRRQLLVLLSRSKEQRDLEDDPKRQLKLEQTIADSEQKLEQATTDLCHHGLAIVRERKAKVAYESAIALAQCLLQDQPQHLELQREMHELQILQQQAAKVDDYNARLFAVKDSRFKAVRIAVKQALQTEMGRRAAQLMGYLDLLFNGAMEVDDFLEAWQDFQQNPAVQGQSFAHVEKQGIAQRIRTGSMVLFLGSGVAGNHAQEAVFAAQLATQVNYAPLSQPSLSAVAEYYRMKLDLGVARLLQDLQAILPQDAQQVGLYQQLAAVSARLILVSAAYDDLLEQAFIAAAKPFVSLTSVIQQGQASAGHVVVSFSDDNAQVGIYPKEAISGLDLGHYSVIYKIKGSCRVINRQTVRTDTLALSENDYFNFARHADKLMPDYLANEFTDKGFLFVGYHPRHWEDRLLASAVLKRRGFANEPCYRLAATGLEPLEEAFWQRSNVTQYAMNLPELEQYLQQGALA